MKKIALFIFVLSTLFVVQTSRAQDTLVFNSAEFYTQVSDILLSTPSKRYGEKSEVLLERFYARWNIGRFNRAEKEEVRRLFEMMRTKKLKTYPYLYDYIYALTLLSESKQLPKSIIAWHVYAQNLLKNVNTNDFAYFLKFTRQLFEDERLFDKKNLSWYYRKARFTFELDSSFLIKYDHLKLVSAAKKDSSVILKTKGVFNYDEGIWSGKGGTIKWSRFGEETGKKIFVELDNYQIDFKQSTYVVDSAVLHYDRFFEQPVLGSFSDKVISGSPNKRTSYPRFESYLDDFELENIYPDINYIGGFSLRGKTFYGIGGPYTPARITFWKEGKKAGQATAEMIKLGEDKFQAVNAQTIFYFDKDSIYHPGLRLKYSKNNKTLVLFNESLGSDMVPFFDSYHQLDIYSQALTWRMDSVIMNFERITPGGGNKKTVRFVSSNYFSEREFYMIQGIDEVNPMYIIRNYLNTYSGREIQLNSLAEFMDKSSEQASSMLISLAKKGFVVYDSKTQTATVKDKLLHTLEAKVGDRDYDVISIESNVTRNPNASVNLQSFQLDVFGVPEVHLSDSQEMYIFPYDKTISFRKNRDFTFDGQIHTGLFEFFTHQSTFVYDSFMVSMNYVDSIKFKVYVTDTMQNAVSQQKIKSLIVDLNGKLYIDQPFNKSGLVKYDQYPLFVSEEESYVYYNQRSIQDSTLLPESFYYRLEPFIFDSISTFNTEGLSFDGTLVSAGIFEPLHESLKVMPDFSLGIHHFIPNDSAYPVYGGKGKFHPELVLSNEGFHGSGELEYLNSTTTSEYFTFYPDSVFGRSSDFAMNDSIKDYDYPDVLSDTVNITWKTDTNVMRIDLLEDPFGIYGDATFDGDLYLDGQKLRGDGRFLFGQSEIISKNIQFQQTKLTADSADFFLSGSDTNVYIFESKGYYATIDFENQKGSFKHLYNNSFVKFPFNKYISTLEEVEWFMDEDRLTLHSDLTNGHAAIDSLDYETLIDYPLSGHEFISIKEGQDSLRFFAGLATYNLQQYTIDVEGVKLIKVADAAIFPENGNVKILRNAVLNKLENASIIADTANKYHHFYNADVIISNRNTYAANGFIDYVDRNNARQSIKLDTIFVDNNGTTNASAKLAVGELFFLSPEYFFTGSIHLIASNPFMQFTGGYRINEDCVGSEDNWVSFSKRIDPNNIFFELNANAIDFNNKNAFFGLGYSYKKKNYYPLILQSLPDTLDQVLVSATGKIDFDTINNSYRLGPSNRKDEGKLQSNFVQLNTNRCIIEGDGILNLGLDWGLSPDTFKWKAAGTFKHLIVPDSTYLNTVLLLDFHFDKKASTMMADSIRIANLAVVNAGEGLFPMFLTKVLGAEKSALLITELNLYGQMTKVPKEIEHTLLFTDLHLKWDPNSHSFISQGAIGLGYIAGTAVNKYVNGYVQIEKGRSADAVHMYIEVSKKQWYFFSYRYGIMQVISSDDTFNTYIEELNPNKRILNHGRDAEYYEFVISSRRKKIDFVRKMERISKR
jgi:hypothetical protein